MALTKEQKTKQIDSIKEKVFASINDTILTKTFINSTKYQIKRRPQEKLLPVIVGSMEQAKKYFIFNRNDLRLANKFKTIILFEICCVSYQNEANADQASLTPTTAVARMTLCLFMRS